MIVFGFALHGRMTGPNGHLVMTPERYSCPTNTICRTTGPPKLARPVLHGISLPSRKLSAITRDEASSELQPRGQAAQRRRSFDEPARFQCRKILVDRFRRVGHTGTIGGERLHRAVYVGRDQSMNEQVRMLGRYAVCGEHGCRKCFRFVVTMTSALPCRAAPARAGRVTPYSPDGGPATGATVPRVSAHAGDGRCRSTGLDFSLPRALTEQEAVWLTECPL